ncbi:MAG: PilZ domain-containing protein [Bdellovibrionota bacterium]
MPASEKRIEPRRNVYHKWVIAISPSTEEGKAQSEFVSGIIIDLSSKGVGVFLPEYIDVQTRVVALVKANGSEQQVHAEVRWCNRIPTSGRVIKAKDTALRWRAGLRFDFQSDEQRQAIKQLYETLK